MFLGYLLIGLVIYLSVTSHPVKFDLAFPYQDKLSHALAYFVLMTWFVQIYHGFSARLVQAVLFVAMGALLEYVQSFDPARMAEIADMLANTAGVLFALLLSMSTSFCCLLQRLERMIMNKDG